MSSNRKYQVYGIMRDGSVGSLQPDLHKSLQITQIYDSC